MLNYLRYALATLCFAASVGCLALLGENTSEWCFRVSQFTELIITVSSGLINVELYTAGAFAPMSCRPAGFPLLGLALIFALDGVAALRLGGEVTRLLAIIATTVVAGLMGMTVIL